MGRFVALGGPTAPRSPAGKLAQAVRKSALNQEMAGGVSSAFLLNIDIREKRAEL